MQDSTAPVEPALGWEELAHFSRTSETQSIHSGKHNGWIWLLKVMVWTSQVDTVCSGSPGIVLSPQTGHWLLTWKMLNTGSTEPTASILSNPKMFYCAVEENLWIWCCSLVWQLWSTVKISLYPKCYENHWHEATSLWCITWFTWSHLGLSLFGKYLNYPFNHLLPIVTLMLHKCPFSFL